MTDFKNAIEILVVAYILFFVFVYLFWLDAPGSPGVKRYQLLKIKFPKKRIRRLCGRHLMSHLPVNRIALLDSENCDVCCKQNKKALTNN